jgi:hypothetical protein
MNVAPYINSQGQGVINHSITDFPTMVFDLSSKADTMLKKQHYFKRALVFLFFLKISN